MKRLTIEQKILFPFIAIVIIPIICIGLVSYWTSFQAYQEQVFRQTELAVDQWIKWSKIIGDEYGSEFLSELNGLKTYSSLAYIGKDITEDGWYLLENRPFWQHKWILVREDTSQNIYYVYPVSFSLWTESLIAIQKYTLLVVIIAGIIAVQFTILFSHHIARPIRQLATFCSAIGTGKIRFSLLEGIKGRGDEIEVLGTSLQEMVQTLEEKNRSLLHLKEFQDSILQSTLLGIYTVRLDGRSLSANNRWKEIAEEIPHFEDKVNAWIIENQPVITASPVPILSEIWHMNHTEKEMILVMEMVPLIHEKGEIVGILCTGEDITERKKLEEKMERMDKLASLGELTAGLAHEVRNPLAGIKTTSQVLRRRLQLDEQNQKLFTSIEKEIDRLNKTITSLLLFAKPKEAEQEDVHLATIFRETLQMVIQPIEEKKIYVEHSVSENIWIYTNPDHLKQIVLNLLINAIKVMGQDDVLRMVAFAQQDKIKIKIIDSGYGMEEEIKAKIFNPFFTTDPNGTGLGLSVVHQLVLQNNGEIEVHSKVNEGTTFTIILPKGKEGFIYEA